MAPEKAVAEDLVLDLASFQLIRAGQRVKLEKTPMELLTLLVRRQGALVTREEIVGAIWGEAVHVDVDAGINTAIRKIRQALDDNADAPRYLETVVGKGYRFIRPITVVNKDLGMPAPPSASAPRAQPSQRTKVVLLAAGLAIGLLFGPLSAHCATRAVFRDSQGPRVIAVAPLENLSADPGQHFFVQGLTEEVITQL